MTTFSS